MTTSLANILSIPGNTALQAIGNLHPLNRVTSVTPFSLTRLRMNALPRWRNVPECGRTAA